MHLPYSHVLRLRTAAMAIAESLAILPADDWRRPHLITSRDSLNRLGGAR